MNITKKTFRIANFNISVKSHNSTLVFDDGLKHFFVEDTNNIDLNLNCYPTILDDFQKSGKTLQTAEYNGSKLWEITNHKEGVLLHVYNPHSLSNLMYICLLRENSNTWDIYVDEVKNSLVTKEINALKHPMLSLTLSRLCLMNNALMIHASGLEENGNGYLFSGQSGVGKTTIVSTWSGDDFKIINDDRIIIRKIKNKYHLFNTPMDYKDVSKTALLKAIYIIYQNDKNKLQQITGANAIANVLVNCIQQTYDKSLLSTNLKSATELCRNIPIYKLGVLKDSNIAGFIREHG